MMLFIGVCVCVCVASNEVDPIQRSILYKNTFERRMFIVYIIPVCNNQIASFYTPLF